MKKGFLAVLTSISAVLVLCSCATKYDTDQKFIYVDRESLEGKDPSQIMSQAIDLDRMEDEKKLNIGILLNINNMTGKRGLPNLSGFTQEALKAAYANLTATKAYNVTILPPKVTKNDLMSGKEFENVKYSFLIDMNIALAADIKETYDHDEALYKTTLTWILIDNRTKNNGGELDAPSASQANICRSICAPIDLKVSSLSGSGGLSGSNQERAQNQLLNAMNNTLFEFKAQLMNRIPFGGKVREIWELDEKIYMRLADAEKMGVTPSMQMLIVNERGNKVAIATANGGNKGITLEVWRWLSKSLKGKICKIASDDEAAAKYLKKKQNRLYAVCLGMPKPAKDEITNFKDTK